MFLKQPTDEDQQDMESTIHTLHEFMLHTESITYILIVTALIGITGFWIFLSGQDDD